MSGTTEDAAIRPFRLDVPEEGLAEPRRRVAATRWPLLRRQRHLGFGCRELFRLRALSGAAEWTERAYPNLIFNEVDKGNHFPAWPEPELFTMEVRAAFRSLR